MKHAFARQLRQEQTDAECRLWHALRGRRFQRFKFRRQQPVGPYIADFVCFWRKVIVELDGDQHGSEQGLSYDAARSAKLRRDGFRVLRFPNRDALGNLEEVLDVIARALSLPADPSPAPRAERAGRCPLPQGERARVR